jgi:hypothetical protein
LQKQGGAERKKGERGEMVVTGDWDGGERERESGGARSVCELKIVR